MPRRKCYGARRAVCQRGRAVGNAQSFGPRVTEVAAIERLGWHPGEVPMLAKTLEPCAVDLARPSERTVTVETLAGTARAPVVDRSVARPGIEGEQRPVLTD